MRTNLIMFRLHQMKDNMRGKPIITPIIAEPLTTTLIATFNNPIRIGDTAVGASMGWPLFWNWICWRFIWIIIWIWFMILFLHSNWFKLYSSVFYNSKLKYYILNICYLFFFRGVIILRGILSLSIWIWVIYLDINIFT